MKETDDYIEITDDEPREDNRPVDIPVITIESVRNSTPNGPTQEKKRKWRRPAIYAVGCLLILLIAYGAWRYRFWYLEPGIKSSVSDSDNIASLSSPTPKTSEAIKGIPVTTDSILGVSFDAYPLDRLRGSLERELPDTTDKRVVLMMRGADYYPDGSTIGTVVVNGEAVPAKEKRSRPGYIALSKDGKTTLGISLGDRVSDYVEKNNGSFFRQFAMLGSGDLPKAFALHGKVERGAIGRMTDGSLYYFLTHNRESMYDFADALREYGVVDAVYITGGKGYEFYRDDEGHPHISKELRQHYDKYPDRNVPSPLLVFRLPE